MLDIANDIRSLSDFKRNTSELLDRLKKTGNPLILTINGKALDPDQPVRVLNFGRSPHVYRVFFTVDGSAKIVRVLHVRRGARGGVAPRELRAQPVRTSPRDGT